MKKFLVVISIMLFSEIVFSQTELKATMGINLISQYIPFFNSRSNTELTG